MSLEIVYSAQEFEVNQVTGETVATGQLYTLAFDAVVREKTGLEAVLTEHAVEGGAAINDHKYTKLRSISLECVVTDTPLGPPPSSGSRTQPIQATVEKVDLGSGLTAQALVYSQEVKRVSDVLAELEGLVGKPVPVTVRTDLQVYEDMQVVGVSRERTAEDGSAVSFAVELKEVRRASVETTTAPRPRRPVNRAAFRRGIQIAQEAIASISALSEAQATRPPQRSALSRLTS